MVGWMEFVFPGLARKAYRITSPHSDRYNCVAWALRITRGWWWPVGDHPEQFWPSGAPRDETLAAFQAAFSLLGFANSPGFDRDAGLEKIAIFQDASGVPTHVARQLLNGRWTSKLGEMEDIEHDHPDQLGGSDYGEVFEYMRRPVP